MYTLYVKKSEKIIKLTKARSVFKMLDFKDEVTRFNDCYFICTNRKPLKEKAEEIKQSWISELEEELQLARKITF